MMRGFEVSSLLEWLLDLESIRLGRDAPLLLEWHHHPPAWMLFCCALAVATWVAMVYRREGTSPRRRILLAVNRCALVGLVVVLACGPALVLQRNRIESSHVAIVLDTSQSMATRDFYQDEPLARAMAQAVGIEDSAALARRSRFDLVVSSLLRDDGAPLGRLLERNAIQLHSFAGGVEAVGRVSSSDRLPGFIDLFAKIQPDGTRTDLAGALRTIVEKAEGGRLAAVILATDGQATESTSLQDALDAARGRQIPVFALRVGSPRPAWDIVVGPVRAESQVFADDLVSIEVELSGRGLTKSVTVPVHLIDERTNTLVATKQIVLDPAHPKQTTELSAKPPGAGRILYRVEVPALPGEHTADNNMQRTEVTVRDDRIHVLYIEGYPRYEYRYLKNALQREKTIELSVLLLEADEQFIQEGTEPIRRFPETPEELGRYDVVLFGDADPRGGWLSRAQMNMLLDFVGNLGGGFGLIAGERSAPRRYLGTPLARLLPIRIDPKFLGRYDAPLTTGFHPRLTPEGRRSRLFRLTPTVDGPHSATDNEPSLFETLPELFWFARTLGPKPGATVLVEHPARQVDVGLLAGSPQMPMLVVGRYGAGKILFQATDDTWRWRRGDGELLHDAYWVQLTRELMRTGPGARDRRLSIRTDRRVYTYGMPVQTQVEVFDSELLAAHPETLELIVTELRGVDVDRHAAGEMRRSPSLFVVGRFDCHRLASRSRVFEGTYVPPHSGSFAITIGSAQPRLGEQPMSAHVRVERPNLEFRRPEADHAMLERIAAATGGSVIDLDQLEAVFSTIRDRSVRIPDDVVEPLWDTKLALSLFVLLVSVEWILRKAAGLL